VSSWRGCAILSRLPVLFVHSPVFRLSNRSVLCSVDVVRWMVERFVVFLRGGVDRAQKQTSTLSGVHISVHVLCDGMH